MDYLRYGANVMSALLRAMMGMVGAGAAVEVTNTFNGHQTGSSPYTHSSVTLGTGDIYVAVGSDGATDPSGITVDGNAMTKIVTNMTSSQPTSIWQYVGNTAATGDIVVTAGGAPSTIGVWLVTGASATVDEFGGASGAGTVLSDTTVHVPANGAAIAASNGNTAATFTWVIGADASPEDYEATSVGGSRYTGASAAFASEQTNITISVTASASSSRYSMSFLTLSPA